MLEAAEHSPQHLQTLSHLSHVLSVNLLSSRRRTGRHKQIWRSQARLRGTRQETFTLVPCWRSCSCSLCTRDHVAVLQASSDTTNPLATANIDVPPRRCRTTSAPSVGCSCYLMVPSGGALFKTLWETMRGGQSSVCTTCKTPFSLGYMASVHGDCDQNNMSDVKRTHLAVTWVRGNQN